MKAELIEDEFGPRCVGIFRSLLSAGQLGSLLSGRTTLCLSRRCRFVQLPLRMHVTNHVHVFRHMPQHTFAAVQAVADQQELTFWEPATDQFYQFHSEFRAGAVLDVGFPLLARLDCFVFFCPLISP